MGDEESLFLTLFFSPTLPARAAKIFHELSLAGLSAGYVIGFWSRGRVVLALSMFKLVQCC